MNALVFQNGMSCGVACAPLGISPSRDNAQGWSDGKLIELYLAVMTFNGGDSYTFDKYMHRKFRPFPFPCESPRLSACSCPRLYRDVRYTGTKQNTRRPRARSISSDAIEVFCLIVFLSYRSLLWLAL